MQHTYCDLVYTLLSGVKCKACGWYVYSRYTRTLSLFCFGCNCICTKYDKMTHSMNILITGISERNTQSMWFWRDQAERSITCCILALAILAAGISFNYYCCLFPNYCRCNNHNYRIFFIQLWDATIRFSLLVLSTGMNFQFFFYCCSVHGLCLLILWHSNTIYFQTTIKSLDLYLILFFNHWLLHSLSLCGFQWFCCENWSANHVWHSQIE